MGIKADDNARNIVEEMAKDRGQTIKRKRTVRAGKSSSFWTTGARSVLMIGIIIVLLLTVVLLLTGDKDADFTEELLAIDERLNKIEMNLERLDLAAGEFPGLTKKMDGFSESIGSLERDRRDTLTRIDTLSNRLDDLSKVVAKSAKSVSSAPQSTATHTVKKGDTLFSIAKHYGLSVDEIYRINGLGKNAVIQPGQELLVK
jgi:LysM repeat protein